MKGPEPILTHFHWNSTSLCSVWLCRHLFASCTHTHTTFISNCSISDWLKKLACLAKQTITGAHETHQHVEQDLPVLLSTDRKCPQKRLSQDTDTKQFYTSWSCCLHYCRPVVWQQTPANLYGDEGKTGSTALLGARSCAKSLQHEGRIQILTWLHILEFGKQCAVTDYLGEWRQRLCPPPALTSPDGPEPTSKFVSSLHHIF